MTGSPISWDERHGGFWSVTGYQECRAAAGARDGLASAPHVHIPPSGLARRGLRIYALESDGAEHRQERAVLLDTLGPSASARFEEHIRALADRLLASLDWAAAPDLASGYAFRLPLEVICDIVAVPGDLRPELRDLTNTLGFRAASEDQAAAAAQRVIEIAGATIAGRRAAPPGDWLDTLIAASPDDGSLDAAPVRAVVALITGGHHSTSRGIASLIARILTDPALRALVAQDPGRLPAAAEEVLRLHTPLPSFSRRATEDRSIGDTAIGTGEQLLLDYAAANRDPAVYPEPERFELDRRPQHLAFGWGPHRCVGMHLARAQMRIAAAGLLAFAPDIELAEPVRWRGPAEPERLLVRSAAAERAASDTAPGRCPAAPTQRRETC
ncbi:MAG TPA: cytochrome P450 [Trebonia sp.]|jgi:cytochrome P450|nr:cytochrome P450 [Trebonia sp.]